MLNFLTETVNPLWILSQIIALPAMFFIAKAFRYSDIEKDKARLYTVFHNLTLAVGSALLMNWIMATVLLIAGVRDLIFNWREKRHPDNRALSIGIFAFFMIISLVSSLITISWWFDWLLMGAALFMIYATWVKGMAIMFWGRFMISSFAIVSHWTFDNYLTDIISEITIIVVSISFLTKKKALQQGGAK
jgi:hypothetical protein